MKTRNVFALLAVMIFIGSTSFSECGAYKEEDSVSPSASPEPPISGPMVHSTILGMNHLLPLLQKYGLPVSALSASKTCITFTDDRLSHSQTPHHSGTLFTYPSYEEAVSNYRSLTLDNPDHYFIYQTNNLVLRLSPEFTKGQAKQYKTIFNLLSYLSEAPSSPESSPTTPSISPPPSKEAVLNGVYIIGTFIKQGEYVIQANGGCCHVMLQEGTGKRETIYKGNFYNDIILTLKPTDVLTITNGILTPIDKKPSLPSLEEGMFKVGTHLKPGTYTVRLSDRNIIGIGTVQLMKDSRFQEDSILSSETFSKPYKITLNDGQYIKLSGASLIQ